MDMIDESVLASLPETEYVYILKDLDITGYYKIGMTKNISQRITHFGVTLPFRVGIVRVMPTMNARALESVLHRRYAACRKDGEWFDLSDADLQEVLSMGSDVCDLSRDFVVHFYTKKTVNQVQLLRKQMLDYLGEERAKQINLKDESHLHRGYGLYVCFEADFTRNVVVVARKIGSQSTCMFYTGIAPVIATYEMLNGIGRKENLLTTITEVEGLMDLLKIATVFARQLEKEEIAS